MRFGRGRLASALLLCGLGRQWTRPTSPSACKGDSRSWITAVIFSTHYLEEADEACDSLVIIDHGRRVAAGPLGDLLEAVADPATVITLGNGETVSFDDRDLLAAINSVDRDQIAEVVVERPSVRRLYERVIGADDGNNAAGSTADATPGSTSR